ncbi:unnamed protein product [Vitrella brassicaformis CCMP3155]|uniref:CBS domain-containing protein n=2 Tax=Vitrella brassicaformis TaxID=1169539 RepID=A0A0G4G5D9_VITBC|nr:unnamed protein product [Vitrella brassicaformis CCMP3155]|eukprot:CEM23786.1 unnamed protein product [Vitrella brassicaformis CCMP3155]
MSAAVVHQGRNVTGNLSKAGKESSTGERERGRVCPATLAEAFHALRSDSKEYPHHDGQQGGGEGKTQRLPQVHEDHEGWMSASPDLPPSPASSSPTSSTSLTHLKGGGHDAGKHHHQQHKAAIWTAGFTQSTMTGIGTQSGLWSSDDLKVVEFAPAGLGSSQDGSPVNNSDHPPQQQQQEGMGMDIDDALEACAADAAAGGDADNGAATSGFAVRTDGVGEGEGVERDVSGQSGVARLTTLLGTPIGQVLSCLGKQELLSLPDTVTVLEFCEMLHNRRLRTAVVYHPRRKWCGLRKSRPTYSFMDVTDVSYLLMRMNKDWKNKNFREVLTMAGKTKIDAVANISKHSPFIRHQITDTVGQIIAAFKPCTRVPIFDGDRLVRVISPSDILTLVQKFNVVKEIGRDLSFGKALEEPIITMLESGSLLKAMAVMEGNNLAAVPIVSEMDPTKLKEVITARDIKYLFLAAAQFPQKDILHAPAIDFVKFVREKGCRPDVPFLKLQSSVSAHDILEAFVTTKTHRVILEKNRGKMLAIVKSTDVLESLAGMLGMAPREEKSKLETDHPYHNRA